MKFVGFDVTKELIKAMEENKIHGLTVQNPFNMGYLGVKTAVQAIKGETVDKRIDTGATMVTAENLNDPEVKKLLNPDLKKWLGE